MSRHPFSQYWKGPVAFMLAALTAFIVFLWTGSHLLAIASLLVAVIAYGVYAIGESSDLPGTAGWGNENVPT